MADLEDFLEEQRDSGHLDSSGQFSLDWVRQAQLTADLLPAKAFLILKWIQGLHQFPEFNEIRLTRHHGLLRLHGCWENQAFSAVELKEAMAADPLRLAESGLKDIALALRTALTLPSTCGLRLGGSIVLPAFEDQTVTDPGLHLCLKIDELERDWEDLLERRCRFSRLPIFLDGKPLGDPQGSGVLRLGELLADQPGGPGFRIRPRGRACYSRLLEADLWDPSHTPVFYRNSLSGHYISEHQSYSAKSFASIPLAMSGPTYLLAVKHGVTLEPLTLLEDCGCEVVVDADLVPLDLSFFAAREGEELSQCRKQGLILLDLLAQELQLPMRRGLYKRGRPGKEGGDATVLDTIKPALSVGGILVGISCGVGSPMVVGLGVTLVVLSLIFFVSPGRQSGLRKRPAMVYSKPLPGLEKVKDGLASLRQSLQAL